MTLSSTPSSEAREIQPNTYQEKLLNLAEAGFLYLVSINPFNVSLMDNERAILNPYADMDRVEVYSCRPSQMPLDGELRNRALLAYSTLKIYLSVQDPRFILHRNVSSPQDEDQLPYSLGKSKYRILFNPLTNVREIWMKDDRVMATDEAVQEFRGRFPEVVFAHLEGKSRGTKPTN